MNLPIETRGSKPIVNVDGGPRYIADFGPAVVGALPAGVGAPRGNKNAAKAHIFYDAVKRAIAQDDGKRLRAAAEKLLDLAAEGTPWAVQELANRLDGKPSQSVALTGDDGGPVQLGFKVVLG